MALPNGSPAGNRFIEFDGNCDILWDMQRIVLDTSVLVSAFRSRSGAANQVLRHVIAGRLIVIATQAIFYEYEAVLKRTEHRMVTGHSLQDVDDILASFAGLVEALDVKFRWRPRLRDANDEMILEAAVNGNADAIVTFNVKDFHGVSEMFGIRILTPINLLEDLADE